MCTRCGAAFGCAVADGIGNGTGEPCWCTRLPPAVALPPPGSGAGCWCRACLEQHIASGAGPAPDSDPVPPA